LTHGTIISVKYPLPEQKESSTVPSFNGQRDYFAAARGSKKELTDH
jgi:hypothetical protein